MRARQTGDRSGHVNPAMAPGVAACMVTGFCVWGSWRKRALSDRPLRHSRHPGAGRAAVVQSSRDSTARGGRGVRVAGDDRGAGALRPRWARGDQGGGGRRVGAARLCRRRDQGDLRRPHRFRLLPQDDAGARRAGRRASRARRRQRALRLSGACLRARRAAGHHLLRRARLGSLSSRHHAVDRALDRRRDRKGRGGQQGRVAVRRRQHLRRPVRSAAGDPPLSRQPDRGADVRGDVSRHGRGRGHDPGRLCAAARAGVAALSAGGLVHVGAGRAADGQDHHARHGPGASGRAAA